MFSSKHSALQGENLRPLLLLLRSGHAFRSRLHPHRTPPLLGVCSRLQPAATCSAPGFLDHISPSPLCLPVQTEQYLQLFLFFHFSSPLHLCESLTLLETQQCRNLQQTDATLKTQLREVWLFYVCWLSAHHSSEECF